MSTAPTPPDRLGDATGPRTGLYRFEVRVRTVMSRALVASLPVRTSRTAVPRRAVYSLRVDGDCDIADVVARFSQAGVQVLEITARSRAGRPVSAA
jgi:hypothetical protein